MLPLKMLTVVFFSLIFQTRVCEEKLKPTLKCFFDFFFLFHLKVFYIEERFCLSFVIIKNNNILQCQVVCEGNFCCNWKCLSLISGSSGLYLIFSNITEGCGDVHTIKIKVFKHWKGFLNTQAFSQVNRLVLYLSMSTYTYSWY